MPMSRISAVSTAGQRVRARAPATSRVEQPGGPQVPLGRGVEGEPERLRRGQRDRHAVRHDRLVVRGSPPGRKSRTRPAIG